MGFSFTSFLAIVGTAAAVIMFNRLIKETTAIFASTVTYLIPIVAVGWGLSRWRINFRNDLLFMLLILTGIFLINMKSPFGYFAGMSHKKINLRRGFVLKTYLFLHSQPFLNKEKLKLCTQL